MKQTIVAVVCLTLICSSATFAAVGGGDVSLSVKGAGNVVFSHDNHVAAGLACTACHDKLYLSRAQHKKVTMKQMQQGKSCGACHNGKQAFSVKSDCVSCHKK